MRLELQFYIFFSVFGGILVQGQQNFNYDYSQFTKGKISLLNFHAKIKKQKSQTRDARKFFIRS